MNQQLARRGSRARMTPAAAVSINAGFLALALAGALAGGGVLGLSVAALVGINGLLHVGASLGLRHYVPGTVSAVALSLPLSALAFAHESPAASTAAAAIALAALLHSVPPLAVALSR